MGSKGGGWTIGGGRANQFMELCIPTVGEGMGVCGSRDDATDSIEVVRGDMV
jgi:hypothetical protein